jgi:hypothetical protein
MGQKELRLYWHQWTLLPSRQFHRNHVASPDITARDYNRHDASLAGHVTKLLGGALDDGVRPDPDRRRKQVFDAFFNVIKSDETYAREMCRFWFEQAYPDLKKQARSKKT